MDRRPIGAAERTGPARRAGRFGLGAVGLASLARELVNALALVLLLAPAPARADLLDGVGAEDDERPPRAGPLKQAWEAERGGREAAKPHLRERLAGWPARLAVDPRELPTDDRAFLERLARDTWRGLEAMVDRPSGLPIDHLAFRSGSLAPHAADIGDYASTTNLGLYLVATVAARELGLEPGPEALARAQRLLDTMERLERRHGFFYNYYDTTTLERTTDFVSFVDSAWLAAGLMVARASFPELRARCTQELARKDYGVFYDRRMRLMVHGFYVEPLRRSPYHYGTLYTEARLGSLIAIGKGDVPADHWFGMVRAGALLDGSGGEEARANGHGDGLPRRRADLRRASAAARLPRGSFEWKGMRYVPSWGGSMFEALMPSLVLDERRLAPEGLGRNAEVHARVQRRYALEQLRYPVWGLSPSWSPAAGAYEEYGVQVLGTHGYRAGAVTPHAAALALAVMPEEAAANLRALAARYPAYGDFGFYDAVDPTTGAVAQAYLTLDQAMILVALANHLRGGVIQQLFASDPIAARMLPLLRGERVAEAGR
jgi:hypothetical protein